MGSRCDSANLFFFAQSIIYFVIFFYLCGAYLNDIYHHIMINSSSAVDAQTATHPNQHTTVTLKFIETPAKGPRFNLDNKMNELKTMAAAYNWPAEEVAKIEKMIRRKTIAFAVACSLYYNNPTSPLRESYRNTINCGGRFDLDPNGHIVITKKCKNRWCPLCNAIHEAELIYKYQKQIDEMKEPVLLTLTRPTCTAEELPEQLRVSDNIFCKIMREFKGSVDAIAKTECTIRPGKMFHLHRHILVEGMENAKKIQQEWIRRNAKLGVICSEEANKMFPAKEGTAKEIFKYFGKLTTKNGKDDEGMIYIDPKSLDVIFRVLHKKRIIRTYGKFKAADVEEERAADEDTRIIITEPIEFDPKRINYFGVNSGMPIIDFKFDNKTQGLINYPKALEIFDQVKTEDEQAKQGQQQWTTKIQDIKNEQLNSIADELKKSQCRVMPTYQDARILFTAIAAPAAGDTPFTMPDLKKYTSNPRKIHGNSHKKAIRTLLAQEPLSKERLITALTTHFDFKTKTEALIAITYWEKKNWVCLNGETYMMRPTLKAHKASKEGAKTSQQAQPATSGVEQELPF